MNTAFMPKMATKNPFKPTKITELPYKKYEWIGNPKIIPLWKAIDLDEINKLLIKEFKYAVIEGVLIIQFYNEDLPIHAVKIKLHQNHKPLHIIQGLVLAGCKLIDWEKGESPFFLSFFLPQPTSSYRATLTYGGGVAKRDFGVGVGNGSVRRYR